jgi:hypothetical protein
MNLDQDVIDTLQLIEDELGIVCEMSSLYHCKINRQEWLKWKYNTLPPYPMGSNLPPDYYNKVQLEIQVKISSLLKKTNKFNDINDIINSIEKVYTDEHLTKIYPLASNGWYGHHSETHYHSRDYLYQKGRLLMDIFSSFIDFKLTDDNNLLITFKDTNIRLGDDTLWLLLESSVFNPSGRMDLWETLIIYNYCGGQKSNNQFGRADIYLGIYQVLSFNKTNQKIQDLTSKNIQMRNELDDLNLVDEHKEDSIKVLASENIQMRKELDELKLVVNQISLTNNTPITNYNPFNSF